MLRRVSLLAMRSGRVSFLCACLLVWNGLFGIDSKVVE